MRRRKNKPQRLGVGARLIGDRRMLPRGYNLSRFCEDRATVLTIGYARFFSAFDLKLFENEHALTAM